MNAPSCSHTEAELRVLEVFRQLHPEWVDASGGCQACMLYSLELASGTSLDTRELATGRNAESAANRPPATDTGGHVLPSSQP